MYKTLALLKTWVKSRRACPDETLLAGYADGRLAPPAQLRVSRHAAACARCRDTLSFLAQHSSQREPVPPTLMQQARAFVPGAPRSRWAFAWAPAAVTACMVVLAFAWSARIAHSPGVPSETNAGVHGASAASSPLVATPTAPTAVERVAPTAPGVRTLPVAKLPLRTPRVAVDTASVHLSWPSVPGSLYYQVRLLSVDGDVVWESKLPGTTTTVARTAAMKAGRHFVVVRAFLVDGKTVQPAATPFEIR